MYLHVDGPAGWVPVGDGVVQVLDGVVRVGGLYHVRLSGGEVADALVGLEVVLHPHLPKRKTDRRRVGPGSGARGWGSPGGPRFVAG